MRFQPGDQVIIPPCAVKKLHDSPRAPVWGGVEGYRLGTVVKTMTHSHDQALHQAKVLFTGGAESDLHESELMEASNHHKSIASDYMRKYALGMADDIYLLYFSFGRTYLGVIANQWGNINEVPKYTVLGSTKPVVIVEEDNAHALREMATCPQSFKLTDLPTPRMAYREFCRQLKLPLPATLPLPLPPRKHILDVEVEARTYTSVTHAPDSCLARFTLPRPYDDYLRC